MVVVIDSIVAGVEANLGLILMAFVALFGVLFAVNLYREQDSKRAARATSQRALGTTTGVFGVVMVVLIEGMHVLAEMPGLVLGLIGLGSVMGGVSVEVAAAVMLVTYIVLAGIRGE